MRVITHSLNMYQYDHELEAATAKTPRFSIDGNYKAKCVDVHDGDTCQLAFRVSGGPVSRFTCRMLGYNCAEVAGVGIGDVEKTRGRECREFMKQLILGKIVDIQVEGFDPHGRPLVTIWTDIDSKLAAKIGIEDTVHVCVDDLMLSVGYGAKYDGHGEKKWKELG